MPQLDWHKCKFLESAENLKPLVRARFGREPSSSLAREISAGLVQGRLFYEAAASSPLEIRPLQQFYGMVGFAKAIVVASGLRSLSTLRHAHGLTDISATNSRIADLRLRIETAGTFHEFNDAMVALNRVCYIDNQTERHTVALPTTASADLSGAELSLKDTLSRIPSLESLYMMTFGELANSGPVTLDCGPRDELDFRLRIDDSELFTDRNSLRTIVDRLRSRFPFLSIWRLTSAQRGWGKSIIYFRNVRRSNIDEFGEEYLREQSGVFQELAPVGDQNGPFFLNEGLSAVAGGFSGGGVYAIAPVSGYYVSEFSMQYLGLFLLSSLVRYRPQVWMHAISRSALQGEPADDQILSLIERFLDVNKAVIPDMVVRVLNPHEDLFA